jgi:hypothetical protein
MQRLVLPSASVSTVDLVTLKSRANKHPPHPLARPPAPHSPPLAKNEATYCTTVSDVSKDRSSLPSGSSLHLLVQAGEVLGLLGSANADGTIV